MMGKHLPVMLVILSLLGIALTFQMAEDTMNRDLDWLMEGNLWTYVNPMALIFCGAALGLSLFVAWKRRGNRRKTSGEEEKSFH